ncbi:MAG: guanine deaminase, partial [Candidatus Onthomonas sp.]|nr:guanine deaminase [Candidatus Onthomonas sp.]
MTTIIKGNIIHAPELGRLDILPGGHLVLEDGVIQAISQALPKEYAGLPVTDYGDKLILQSFADCHLHGSQYPFLGTGMDVTLLDWL